MAKYSQNFCSNHCRSQSWIMRNKDKRNKYQRNYHQKFKEEVYRKVGKGRLVCVYCDCNDISFLEINHKNGDGNNERREISGGLNTPYRFWKNIKDGKRKIDDLELVCKLCNWNHYYKLKFKTNQQVIWNPKI